MYAGQGDSSAELPGGHAGSAPLPATHPGLYKHSSLQQGLSQPGSCGTRKARV